MFSCSTVGEPLRIRRGQESKPPLSARRTGESQNLAICVFRSTCTCASSSFVIFSAAPIRPPAPLRYGVMLDVAIPVCSL